MTRWSMVVAGVFAAWVAFIMAWRFFAQIHREQDVREKQLDRREASLDAWSGELAEFDAERVERARAATVLLDRALGPAPSQPDEVLS